MTGLEKVVAILLLLVVAVLLAALCFWFVGYRPTGGIGA